VRTPVSLPPYGDVAVSVAVDPASPTIQLSPCRGPTRSALSTISVADVPAVTLPVGAMLAFAIDLGDASRGSLTPCWLGPGGTDPVRQQSRTWQCPTPR